MSTPLLCPRSATRGASLALLLGGSLLLGSCSSGGDASGLGVGGGNLIVLSTTPPNNGSLFLNEAVAIDFSNPIDFNSVNFNTIAFQAFDASGNPLTEQVTGRFQLARSPGDAEIGRRLEFVPKFPSNAALNNGGFKPSRQYSIQLVGGSQRNGNVILDTSGRPLRVPLSFRISTPNGTSPSELFSNPRIGGPRVTSFSVTPTTTSGPQPGTALSKRGQALVQIELNFDQALNPQPSNVPVNLSPDPTKRPTSRGRIFLQYDDPDETARWIPALVDLAENTTSGSRVVLVPFGVLPNNASIDIVVTPELQDIAGESNAQSVVYNPIIGSFSTRSAFEPQFDGVVETFDLAAAIDETAPFLEPVANIGNGFVRADFGFAGQESFLDYEPTSPDITLNTNITEIQPAGGLPPITVSGGVFEFRNVTIRSGVTVRGQGTRPMVWLCTGDFTVGGRLIVDGSTGDRVITLGSANFATAGGAAGPAAGRGGAGSPNTVAESPSGEAGFGPGQTPRGGGGPGLQTAPGCLIGSAGGGGSLATQGDPQFFGANAQVLPFGQPPPGRPAGAFPQQFGQGGNGCNTGLHSGVPARLRLPGGSAGPRAFVDARADNDFWGSAVDLNRQIRITGELEKPIGGSGGGGGGDRTTSPFPNNNKGGGGGGGGGVLIVQALGTITIESSGLVSANGGNGGGGEQAGGNNQGGGGGAGSGGMVILIAGEQIVIETHGDTFGVHEDPSEGGLMQPLSPLPDFNFACSADGGAGLQESFAQVTWNTKYPPPTAWTGQGFWDSLPAGGFGGLGVVQLMAPPGDNTNDNTNTVLDDNIRIVAKGLSALGFSDGTDLLGADKEAYLGWAGFFDPGSGEWRDDEGLPTYFNTTPTNQGDIRPPPILLPSTLSAKSRVRSIWLDTGATVRRSVTSPDSDPRGIVPSGGFGAGPNYEYAGLNEDGYIATREENGQLVLDFPKPLGQTPLAVLSAIDDASFEGLPAYEITVQSQGAVGPLGSVVDRYSQYRAELLGPTSTVSLGDWRILSHDDRRLILDPDGPPLPASTAGLRLHVLAKFIDVRTQVGGLVVPGLGRAYRESGGTLSPESNVQVGFAFHRDATNAVLPGSGETMDMNRYPNELGTFISDLDDPGLLNEIQMNGAFPFVKWDLVLNIRYAQETANNLAPIGINALGPSRLLTEVHLLGIPFQF